MSFAQVLRGIFRPHSQHASRLLGLAAAMTILASGVIQAQEMPLKDDGDPQNLTLEEKRIVSILKDKIADLEQKEEAVRARGEELKVLRADVENKLEEIKTIRQSLQDRAEKQRRIQDEKVQELSGIYENMNAGRAAAAMLSMDRDLAIGILANMRRKLAGEVLDQMPGKEAAEISRDYSNMKDSEPP
ncbi:MAG: MotE family protein [Desulfovermiculus sp.]